MDAHYSNSYNIGNESELSHIIPNTNLPVNIPLVQNQPPQNFTVKDQHLLKPPPAMGASKFFLLPHVGRHFRDIVLNYFFFFNVCILFIWIFCSKANLIFFYFMGLPCWAPLRFFLNFFIQLG